MINTYGDDEDGLSFALLSFGRSLVMFNEGVNPARAFVREVDLYVNADRVDEMYERLRDRVEVVETPHDTFYGMREFIIRDLHRFWITFGQPIDEAASPAALIPYRGFKATFRLRYGVMSEEYFYKYRFESDPGLLMEIADGLATRVPENIEILAGLELGGIPVATALSIQTGLPAVFLRKQAKEYGTCRLAEGVDRPG